MSQDRPELCGAWAGDGLCTMPKGHNMRRLDIPSNHKCEKPVAAQEPSERLANKLGMMPTDAWRFNGIEASLVIAALYRHAAPCTRCAELEALYSKLDEHCSAGWDKCDELQAKITEHASSVNYLRLRVEQFDRAISRIGHHLHLTLAGVDTEDEHGPGGHSAEAICRKFDKQAERIKDLEALSMQSNQDHLNARKDYRTKLAKADAVILKCKEAMTWDIGGEPLPTLEIAALAAIEQYRKGE